MKLYELSQAFNEVMNMDMDEDVLKDTLESIEGSINDKAENIVKLIRTIEAESISIKQEEDRLKKMRATRENKVKSLKQYLEEQLNVLNKKELSAGLFKIRLQNNPQSVNVLDETLIGAHYFVEQAPKLDKRSLMADLKAGNPIAGAELKQTQSLRIQ